MSLEDLFEDQMKSGVKDTVKAYQEQMRAGKEIIEHNPIDDTAILHFEAAARMDEKKYEPHFQLGTLYFKANKFSKSVAHFERSSKLGAKKDLPFNDWYENGHVSKDWKDLARFSKSLEQLTDAYTKEYRHMETWEEKFTTIHYTLKDAIYFATHIMNLEYGNEYGQKGQFISAMLNKVMTDDDVVELSPKKYLSHLGFRHQRGKLIITSENANNVAEEMIGGEIVVNGNAHTGAVRMKGGKLTINGHFGKYGVHVPDQPCSYMEGGEVLVNGSCDSIGFRLAGGHLNINGECKGDLGAQLSGGYITLQGLYSGHCIGQHMASGTILLSDKGSPREIKAQPGNGSIGEEMNGGSIKFERTNIINFKVGPSMRGGSIVIEGNCCPEHIGTYSPIGIDMSYGKISIQGNTVGTIYLNRLQGGQININQSSDTARLYVDKSASSSKRGGQVYLNGERYYPFTLSFKNISQTFTRVRDVPRY